MAMVKSRDDELLGGYEKDRLEDRVERAIQVAPGGVGMDKECLSSMVRLGGREFILKDASESFPRKGVWPEI
jgi:hypothetical protein